MKNTNENNINNTVKNIGDNEERGGEKIIRRIESFVLTTS